MEILNKDSILDTIETVGTIGFFDGLHLGHKFLIGKLLNISKSEGKKSLVVTFRENPKKFFKKDYDIRQLTTLDEKLEILSSYGVDYCLLLDFTEELSKKTAVEFLIFLKDSFALKTLFVGHDHTFGSDKIRDFDVVYDICRGMGIDAFKVDKLGEVSSSSIRQLVSDGRLEEANSMLGYNYTISGEVVEGQKLGRTIGFPTANIDVSDGKLVPRNGVYAVKVIVDGTIKGGMLNIGNRPTVGGIDKTVEVNIFDFSQDIYGEYIGVEPLKFIREETKFSDLDGLKRQLYADKKAIIDLLKSYR